MHSKSVGIGAKVLMEIDEKPQEWRIVDSGESDVAVGKISYQSPLAQCILGACEGEIIKTDLMGRSVRITIQRIRL